MSFTRYLAGAALMASGFAGSAEARNCVAYADSAVVQQRLNLEYGCRYESLRWHQGWRPHRNWCGVAPIGRPLEEFRIRNARLRACGVPDSRLPAPWLG